MSNTLKTKLTQAIINKALTQTGQVMVLRDTVVPGLSLRIGKFSSAFYLEYKPAGRTPEGKQYPSRSFKLGTPASHNLSEARKDAARLKVEISAGADPGEDKKKAVAEKALSQARAATLGSLASHYIENVLVGSPNHVRTQGGALRLGLTEMQAEALPPQELSQAQIMAMLDKHRASPATARHRYGALRRFFEDLMSRGLVDRNPCDLVPKRFRPRPPAARTRFFSAEEVRALWGASGLKEVELALLRVAILLPLRISELAQLRADEVDLDTRRISLSGKRTKNGDPFNLPMPEAALGLLAYAGKLEPQALVFQLTQAGTRFQSNSELTERIRQASGIEDFNFHHLRRTFMTTLAELGVGNEAVADALLNHRQSSTRSGVLAAYNQASLGSQKVGMMEAWGRLVEQAVETGSWQDDKRAIPFAPRSG